MKSATKGPRPPDEWRGWADPHVAPQWNDLVPPPTRIASYLINPKHVFHLLPQQVNPRGVMEHVEQEGAVTARKSHRARARPARRRVRRVPSLKPSLKYSALSRSPLVLPTQKSSTPNNIPSRIFPTLNPAY